MLGAGATCRPVREDCWVGTSASSLGISGQDSCLTCPSGTSRGGRVAAPQEACLLRVEPGDPVRPQRHLHVLPLPPPATSTRGSRGLPQSQCPSSPVVTVCALVQLLPAPPLQRCTSEPGAGELGECLPGWGCGGRGGAFSSRGASRQATTLAAKVYGDRLG